MNWTTAAALLGLTIASGSSSAASDDEASSAATIAERECSVCHRLPDGSGTALGPDLEAIASGTAPSPAVLQEILGDPPHAGVVQVDPAEMAELVAWLHALAAER